MIFIARASGRNRNSRGKHMWISRDLKTVPLCNTRGIADRGPVDAAGHTPVDDTVTVRSVSQICMTCVATYEREYRA